MNRFFDKYLQNICDEPEHKEVKFWINSVADDGATIVEEGFQKTGGTRNPGHVGNALPLGYENALLSHPRRNDREGSQAQDYEYSL